MLDITNIDWTTVVPWVVTVAIPTGIAIWKAVTSHNWSQAFSLLNDLMNPNVPQTAAQTELIQSGKVTDDTWKISEAELTRILGIIRNNNVNVSENAFRAVVKQAEDNCDVEYAIRICENKSPEVYPTVFISYGVGSFYKTFADAQEIIINHSARVYSVAG